MADIAQLLLLISRGVTTTLSISIFSFLLGLAIGIPLAFMRTYGSKPLQVVLDGYEKVLRGIPELVLLLLFYFGIGLYFPTPFKNAFFTAVFVLGLRSAANQSQVYRGAIRGLGEEQMTVARSLGLSRLRSIAYVMLPQVFIFSTPGLGSEYALLVKDSSYTFFLPGITEIMEIVNAYRKSTGDTITPFLLGALVYILLTFPIASYLDKWGSRKKRQLGL
jgi:polar amino acid transport system permease protein